MIEHFDIAGYCRISVDEELDRDNTSIENQKAILSDFVKHRFPDSALTFYEDRDRSGYTFEQRENYQTMRRELVSHKKDILIVKDFSRFSRRNSRGLVELEDLRDAGVRIISIGENVDFPNDDDWLKIQFTFIINEMPVTDTSKKVAPPPTAILSTSGRSLRLSPQRRKLSVGFSSSTSTAGATRKLLTNSRMRASPPPAWRNGTARRLQGRITAARLSPPGPS